MVPVQQFFFSPIPLPPLLTSLLSTIRQIGYTFFGEMRPEWFGCYSAAMITLTQVLVGGSSQIL